MDKKAMNFAKKLKTKFSPSRLILFGSRARKDSLKDSDYDFLIVSKKFEGIDFLDRVPLVLSKTKCLFDIDLLCYTPKEFEKKQKQIGIVSQALKEGKQII